MIPCNESFRVQDFLDDELAPAEREAFESHLATCEACAADLALFRVVFHRLETLPLLEPGPQLVDRVLAEALPAHAARWVRALGWVYASGLAASLGAIAAAVLLPAPRAWLGGIAAGATHALVNSTMFVLKTFNATALHLMNGMGSSESLWGRGLLVSRTLVSLLAHPAILMLVWGAVLACVAVIWWMRPHEARQLEGSDHVGMLGI